MLVTNEGSKISNEEEFITERMDLRKKFQHRYFDFAQYYSPRSPQITKRPPERYFFI